MNVLVLSGTNHRFNQSAEVIQGFLKRETGLNLFLEEDKDFLHSDEMKSMDVLVFGTGFRRSEKQKDGSVKRVADLTPAQEEGVFDFVSSGKGLVGIHGTAWWIGGRAVDLIGGHANWHPPGLTFTVKIEDTTHEIMDGLADFEVDDEIYMSAWDPDIHILASAEWSDKQHPMAWVKPFGKGKVFYTTLGHGPNTFERPAMQQLVTQAVLWAGN
jgi:type 1 glutamine amidotransferase